MFVPYSRITASVSLYTTSCSPFSSCLSDLPSSTDYIFPPSPSPSCISLSFFSPLSYPAHIFLSYFSLIFLSFLSHSSPPPITLPKPEVTKSDKKKKQAADTGNPSGKKKIGTDKSNTRKQAGTDNGQEAQGRYRARQYKIPQRTSKGRKAESGSSPKTAERQQDPSQLPPHSNTAHTTPFFFRPCGAAG